ncbi:MAG: tRNA pseudouridine(54/55) synthase Pus10 [Thermoproteota archaeon]|nr:MAG: tRNA pseudouridine(54/55) synthase Pus10 [Candidatus Korarchaeota archaeon]
MPALDDLKSLLATYKLCNRCLGRQFFYACPWIPTDIKGQIVKKIVYFETAKNEDTGKECYICGGLINQLEDIGEKILDKLSEYEFKSYKIGTIFPTDVLEREDEIRSLIYPMDAASIKVEFNQYLDSFVRNRTKATIDNRDPDVKITVNIPYNMVHVDVKPIIIAGCYLKYVRNIPQTSWACRHCNGIGCEACNWTGKEYGTSIEDLLVNAILPYFEGEKGILHAGGREDVDVRVLGSGRPFALEIISPKKRNINLEKVERDVNEKYEGIIGVKGLRYADKSYISRVKGEMERAVKTYLALVKSEEPIDDASMEKVVNRLKGAIIHQRTPRRVAHRRVDRVRLKRIYDVSIRRVSENMFKMTVKCEGGTYVKELITGDAGRTKPSVSDILGLKVECIQLDVIDIGESNGKEK